MQLVRSVRVASLVALAMVGCSDTYVIGAAGVPAHRYCPEGVDCRGRFEISLSHAGTSAWGDQLLAGSAARAPALLLRGEDATAERWTARTGGALIASGARVGIEGPFTDATRGVSTAVELATEGAIAHWPATDLVVELVLRAAPDARILRATATSRELVIESHADGALTLAIAGSTLSTGPLTEGAWYHVIFEVHGGRPSAVHVDAARTEAPPISASSGEEAHAITVGGAGDAVIAWLAVMPWGDVALDEVTVLERFARLVGVAPSLAGGGPLPIELARDSVAFVDRIDSDGARRLHLVGERWPRIACRPDVTGAPFCGYLAEAGAGRHDLPFDPVMLDAEGATLVALDRARSVGAHVPMVAVTGDVSTGVHGVTAPIGGGGTLVLSFFARTGAATQIEASFGELGSARLDLATGSTTSDVGVVATQEAFGAGIVRCTLVVRDAPDQHRVIAVRAIQTDSTAFLDDGAVLFELGGLQLEGNRLSATSLVLDDRASDHLVFAARDNVPIVGTGTLRVRALAAMGERLHDETLVNASRGASPDEQLNLYVSTPGTVIFAAASGAELRWLIPSTASAVGGVPVDVEAYWSPSAARLRVDDDETTRDVTDGIEAAAYDRLAIGWSGSTSGVADGLVGEIGIGP